MMSPENIHLVIGRVMRTDAGGTLTVDLTAAPELTPDEWKAVIDRINQIRDDLCRSQVRRSAYIGGFEG